MGDMGKRLNTIKNSVYASLKIYLRKCSGKTMKIPMPLYL